MQFSDELVRLGTVMRCMEWLREGRAQPHTDLVIKLLCNTTTLEQGSRDLLQLGQNDLEGFNMCAELCCGMSPHVKGPCLSTYCA